MAQKIATSFPLVTSYLVGPIGPRSHALLHPSIARNNSTKIVQDEVHVILEYKQGARMSMTLFLTINKFSFSGEILGEYVAPASSRFITSHDVYRQANFFLLLVM